MIYHPLAVGTVTQVTIAAVPAYTTLLSFVSIAIMQFYDNAIFR